MLKDKSNIQAESLNKRLKNKKQVEEDLWYQTQMHKILMNISSQYINVPLEDVKDAVNAALGEIGEFVSADRAYVFNYDFEKNIAVNIYEWCNKGIEPQIDNLKSSPLDAAPDLVESHLKGDPVTIYDVSALPSGDLRDILEQQQIKSLITVPMFHEDRLVGFTGFDSTKRKHVYTSMEIELIKFFGQILIGLRMRIQSEEALLESEKKYRHLFKNAPAGIYEIDFEKFRFVNVNDIMCRYTGYSEKEFLSMHPPDLLTENSKNLYIQRLEKLSEGEKLIHNVEHNIIKKDGQTLNVLLSNDFIYENGKLKGARVVAHNITDRKKAEEEKIKAQKVSGEHEKLALVGQIAGKMAHDFNNVLGVIMGNSQLALIETKEPKTKKALELIFKQTIRGKNLTKNLVAFARDQEPKQEFFKINEKIDLVLSLLRKDLEGIELIKENKTGMPDLLADSGMIEHALVNLVQNSIHAVSMVKNPQITMRSYCVADNICFEIEDNGCGILKEHLKKIYEPSFTLKGSKDIAGLYKPDIKGTGYGMSNVKKYIEQHKGNISIESQFGSGTKFIISMPVIKKELTSEEKIKIREETIHFDKYILLVEDEPAISDVQYRILTQEPCSHKVDIASTGQVAMDLFGRNEYDFVSLDYILLGKITGMDIYHHIRKTNKNIPILFVSGNIEFLESVKDLKQKDINIDHLSKPCQNKDYVNSINRLLEIYENGL
ncbi:MAG: PAS domain S-box protein [Desulfobacula sp.]|uniref:PAS domain S-box protein n=1 Tax=Desulfobacula sp. TaxID=2593537 RepID=UPI0025C4B794|nr:PAS domain S-box protein [Desulfobacula sp.]MCD4718932.1 PAS domain S-box protein [Desulfobacula sp.]